MMRKKQGKHSTDDQTNCYKELLNALYPRQCTMWLDIIYVPTNALCGYFPTFSASILKKPVTYLLHSTSIYFLLIKVWWHLWCHCCLWLEPPGTEGDKGFTGNIWHKQWQVSEEIATTHQTIWHTFFPSDAVEARQTSTKHELKNSGDILEKPTK